MHALNEKTAIKIRTKVTVDVTNGITLPICTFAIQITHQYAIQKSCVGLLHTVEKGNG